MSQGEVSLAGTVAIPRRLHRRHSRAGGPGRPARFAAWPLRSRDARSASTHPRQHSAPCRAHRRGLPAPTSPITRPSSGGECGAAPARCVRPARRRSVAPGRRRGTSATRCARCRRRRPPPALPRRRCCWGPRGCRPPRAPEGPRHPGRRVHLPAAPPRRGSPARAAGLVRHRRLRAARSRRSAAATTMPRPHSLQPCALGPRAGPRARPHRTHAPPPARWQSTARRRRRLRRAQGALRRLEARPRCLHEPRAARLRMPGRRCQPDGPYRRLMARPHCAPGPRAGRWQGGCRCRRALQLRACGCRARPAGYPDAHRRRQWRGGALPPRPLAH